MVFYLGNACPKGPSINHVNRFPEFLTPFPLRGHFLLNMYIICSKMFIWLTLLPPSTVHMVYGRPQNLANLEKLDGLRKFSNNTKKNHVLSIIAGVI